MTPTASSSSILLLNPATQSGTSATGAETQAVPIAGLSGFELLLGAMQQLQQALPETTAQVDLAAATTESEGEQSGNALPLFGMLLPLSGATTEVESTDSKGNDVPVDKKDEAADVDVDFLLFSTAQSTVSMNNNPSSTVTSSTNAGSAQKSINDVAAMNAAINSVDDLVAQVVAPGVGASSKESGANKTDRSTASLRLGSVELGRLSTDASAASSADDVLASAQAIPDVPPAAESDFDMLVKQFDATSTAPETVTSNGVSNSSQVSQASRTYSTAMNSNASVPVPVGNPGWSDAVADKVMWFSANNVTSAEIHLNPPDLGPLQVRVSTQQDQTSVVFTSQHAAVRDALDQALPRLRDMMSSQGMHQLDVSVGGQNAQQQQQQFARNSSSQNGSQFNGLLGDDAADTQATNVTSIDTARLRRSGFDAYA